MVVYNNDMIPCENPLILLSPCIESINFVQPEQIKNNKSCIVDVDDDDNNNNNI